MALRHVKGNTWVWEGSTMLLPLYMVGEKEAVLIDTGYALQEREGLTKLFDEDLTLRGIICTHAHFDHSGNVRYLQQRYGVPVAAHIIEAGISINTEAYRANYIGLTYGKSLAESCRIGAMLAASVIATTESVCPRFLPRELGLDIDVED